jgi:hypothetical protein
MCPRPFFLLVSAIAALATGCGDTGGSASTPPSSPPPTGRVQPFPHLAAGETLDELQAGLPPGPILQPAVSLLERGSNRLAFAIYDTARTPLSGAQVVLYVSRPDGTSVRGPYAARSESLAVKTPFVSRTTAEDPESAKSIYVADVPFTRVGGVSVLALVRLDGRLMRSGLAAMTVGAKGATPPGVGDRAVPIDTDTVASAGGDERSIDTRLPPAPGLHRVDFRNVLGKKPVVLVFATPQLCQSRVCGPVVDIALQAQAAAGDRVTFIHQEVYKGNRVQNGVRPQLGAWRLATEPWTFVVDRKGIVRARFEGPMSPGELERAITKVE